MKKLMVFGILTLFLLSACVPQGSDTSDNSDSAPQESNTAETSDSITIVKNTGLTGTWSGPYTEKTHIDSLDYYGETARSTCDLVSKGIYTFTLTQDQDTFSGTINDVGDTVLLQGDPEQCEEGSYTVQGTVSGTISGSVISGTFILDTIKYPFSGTVSGGEITATHTGIGQDDDIAKIMYSGNFALEKSSSSAVAIPSPSPNELPSYTTTDTQVQFLTWESLEHETYPKFSWKPPMYRPSIKGYWLRIDDGEWKLVESLVFKWKSDAEISNGVHEFQIRPEYPEGKYGMINSLYFTINTDLPDFIVQDVAWKLLRTQGEGESKIYIISITPTVSNQGTKDFMWGLPKVPKVIVNIQYRDDSVSPDSGKGVESIDVGESKVVEFMTASRHPEEFVYGAGEHTIRVTINEDYSSYKAMEEADFSNNEKVITIHLGE